MNTIPPIGLGTSELKGQAAHDAVLAALRNGYRHIDTAKFYGNEQQVGKALKRSGVPREEVHITTKVWPDRFEDLDGSLNESLRDLGVEHVDLLHAHWPKHEWTTAGEPEKTREELNKLMRALEHARQSGKAARIGVSNFPRELARLARQQAPLDAIQIEAHPHLYQPDMIGWAHNHDVHVTAYAPLSSGRGVLSDPIVRATALEAGITPAQAALAWTLRMMDSTPPRSVQDAHQKENLAAHPGMLTPEQAKRMSDNAVHVRRRYFNTPGLAPNWDWGGYAKG